MATEKKLCTFEDCTRSFDSHGFCANHARQYRKYGHPLSKEEKHAHLVESNTGKKQTLGKTWSVQDTSKMTGRHPKSEFKKGQVSWNKGVSWMTPEHKESLRQANIGRTPWNKGTMGLMVAWNKIGDGITSQSKLERAKFNQKMVALVLARDNYTCQFCDQYNGYLHVDHIKGWADYPDLRFDLDNCRTLCRACHYYITFKHKMPDTSKWGLSAITRERG